jgi:hypothetical protein
MCSDVQSHTGDEQGLEKQWRTVHDEGLIAII